MIPTLVPVTVNKVRTFVWAVDRRYFLVYYPYSSIYTECIGRTYLEKRWDLWYILIII